MMKQKRCKFHFVEVMACPSGCLNGGAQIPRLPHISGNQFLQQMDEIYHSQTNTNILTQLNPSVEKLIEECGGIASQFAHKHFHTQYHNIPQNTSEPLMIKW
jgi:iron only hydrogenase large subunit-like protein